jgi:chemotaxis protein CheD
MAEILKVGMADLKIAAYPDGLTTLGLGSCVGVAVYDNSTQIIGLAHVMLPSSQQSRNNTNIAKFADTAIAKLIDDMVSSGARKRNLVAKLAGGAQMFALNQSSDLMRIGYRNVVACKEKLSELGIPIIAEDTGGNFGRTIELNSENGKLLVKTIGHGANTL